VADDEGGEIGSCESWTKGGTCHSVPLSSMLLSKLLWSWLQREGFWKKRVRERGSNSSKSDSRGVGVRQTRELPGCIYTYFIVKKRMHVCQ
jgi:hypothetical protein